MLSDRGIEYNLHIGEWTKLLSMLYPGAEQANEWGVGCVPSKCIYFDAGLPSSRTELDAISCCIVLCLSSLTEYDEKQNRLGEVCSWLFQSIHDEAPRVKALRLLGLIVLFEAEFSKLGEDAYMYSIERRGKRLGEYYQALLTGTYTDEDRFLAWVYETPKSLWKGQEIFCLISEKSQARVFSGKAKSGPTSWACELLKGKLRDSFPFPQGCVPWEEIIGQEFILRVKDPRYRGKRAKIVGTAVGPTGSRMIAAGSFGKILVFISALCRGNAECPDIRCQEFNGKCFWCGDGYGNLTYDPQMNCTSGDVLDCDSIPRCPQGCLEFGRAGSAPTCFRCSEWLAGGPLPEPPWETNGSSAPLCGQETVECGVLGFNPSDPCKNGTWCQDGGEVVEGKCVPQTNDWGAGGNPEKECDGTEPKCAFPCVAFRSAYSEFPQGCFKCPEWAIPRETMWEDGALQPFCADGIAAESCPETTKSPSTSSPTWSPTKGPSSSPSVSPTEGPVTAGPSASPLLGPSTLGPTWSPTPTLTGTPTVSLTAGPTRGPSSSPSVRPTNGPSSSPSVRPSEGPASGPTMAQNQSPTLGPSSEPTMAPISNYTSTWEPSVNPTPVVVRLPTMAPSLGNPGGSSAPSEMIVNDGMVDAPRSELEMVIVFFGGGAFFLGLIALILLLKRERKRRGGRRGVG